MKQYDERHHDVEFLRVEWGVGAMALHKPEEPLSALAQDEHKHKFGTLPQHFLRSFYNFYQREYLQPVLGVL